MKIIVAACKNFGIGFKNNLPWHLKNELKYFAKHTTGNKNNAIIMGSNTWESIPKTPLPNRFNIVLSTKLNLNNNNVKSFTNINDVLQFTNKKKFDDVWVIGGESIYNLFLQENLVKEIYLTKIFENYKCDTFFNYPSTFYLKNTSSLYEENNIKYKHMILQKKNYKS